MRVTVNADVEPDFIVAELPSVPRVGDTVVSDTYGTFTVESVTWFAGDDDSDGYPAVNLEPSVN